MDNYPAVNIYTRKPENEIRVRIEWDKYTSETLPFKFKDRAQATRFVAFLTSELGYHYTT